MLRLSTFRSGDGPRNLEIIGRAWDPLIRGDYPATRPNDNFGHYNLHITKNGTGAWHPIVTDQRSPVPSVRDIVLPAAPGNVGTLASWDIVAALDAGPRPAGDPAAPPTPMIYRGERCAYVIQLYVTDTTQLNDRTSTHQAWFLWPLSIENDL